MDTATARSSRPTHSSEAFKTTDDGMGSILQTDTLLSEQFFDTMRRKTIFEPEKRLMLAILEDAVSTLKQYYRSNNRRNARLFEDTKAWIFDADADWVFSFENICEHLGLNPPYVRQGITRWLRRRSGAPEFAARGWKVKPVVI